MTDHLLERTTARLWADMTEVFEAEGDGIEFEWGTAQGQPYRDGDRVVVPEYNDGYMIHRSTSIKELPDGTFQATNSMGHEATFTDIELAITHAIVP